MKNRDTVREMGKKKGNRETKGGHGKGEEARGIKIEVHGKRE